MRPTAFSRIYSLIWLYIGAYLALVLTTIAEHRYDIAGGYFIVIYLAAVFSALLVSYLELFALPKLSTYAQEFAGSAPPRSPDDEAHIEAEEASPTEPEASEATSLLHGDDRRRTFARYGGTQRTQDEGEGDPIDERKPEMYADEQHWSTSLPSSLWIIQFLLLAPIVVILVGQIGLLLTSALYQTPADGSAVLPIYLFIAILSILILAPIGPFIHRFTIHIPAILLLCFLGTLLYSLTAFPFSSDAPLKVFFVQTVDLDSGRNHVNLVGLDEYIRPIVASLPSAAGQPLVCNAPHQPTRNGLTTCAWPGLAPHVVPTNMPPGVPPETRYADWLHYTVARTAGEKREAVFRIRGANTRACRLLFDAPIADFRVAGAADDERFARVGEEGTREIRLWSRDWDGSWDVTVRWDGEGDDERGPGLDGKVVCLWSDANQAGAIPALEEVWRFIPVWATVSKLDDGLVLGSKAFKV